jgi:hypothetical protein
MFLQMDNLTSTWVLLGGWGAIVVLFGLVWVCRRWVRARRARAKVHVESANAGGERVRGRDAGKTDAFDTLVLRGTTGVAKRCGFVCMCVCVYVCMCVCV